MKSVIKPMKREFLVGIPGLALVAIALVRIQAHAGVVEQQSEPPPTSSRGRRHRDVQMS